MQYEKITEHAWLDRTNETPFLFFPALRTLGFRHGFSTRLGGVSEGCYASMNLGFRRGDSEENVRENYRRICSSIGINQEDLVFTDQVHGVRVRTARAEDKGKGYRRERDYSEVDGQITNEREVPLLAFSADCTPLYFADPVRKAIGLTHSGWKGTAHRIGAETVKRMTEEYGCKPSDITAVIGPSIGPECYEVGSEVYEEFGHFYTKEQMSRIFAPSAKGNPGKYQLNLWEANRLVLQDAGLCGEKIIVSGVCTYCREDLMFSHRRNGSQRGSMAAFLTL
ncbi:MAG: peptidoglycan editing factor PgeF [Lachnospiraceae bacterium]|nr:peptidoglycan editing factor PgeF [Lachnospiraceae bacterium]